ncbi:capsular polysaccharide synthesis protein [Aeromicrobium sp. JJY06]|uniref:capsular polysaccharide synthesis protein n=1 Tax=Aeromicrobium sp. JJY06 TaxID=3373478 RepID=UPI00376ECB23
MKPSVKTSSAERIPLALDAWTPSSEGIALVGGTDRLRVEAPGLGESFARCSPRDLGLASRRPYRIRATANLESPVDPILSPHALRMVLTRTGRSKTREVVSRSWPAVNSYGAHRIELVLDRADLRGDVQLELHLGGRGGVTWSDLRAEPIPGAATRRLRRASLKDVSTSWDARVELARRIAAQDSVAAAELLHSVLDDPRTTASIAHEAARLDQRVHSRADISDKRHWRRRLVAANKTAARLEERLPWSTVVAMLRTRAGNFRDRAHLWQFFEPRIEDLRAAAASERVPARPSDRVFTYWAQGLDHAPPIVRENVARMRSMFGDRLVVLTDESKDDWVPRPAFEDYRPRMVPREHSDVLRLDLLRKYGGLWLDATCLVTAAFTVPKGFFAFPKEGKRAEGTPRLSVWALASEPGGYLASVFAEALHAYWSTYDEALDYYFIHHIFEVLCLLDPTFDEEWQRAATVGRSWGIAPRELYRVMGNEYDPDRAAEILEGSPVHKLNHKGPARRANSRSFLAAVLDGRM